MHVKLKMEPLFALDEGVRSAPKVSWNLCMLLFVIALQFAIFILLLIMLLTVAPVVPDIPRIVAIANETLVDVRHIMPWINCTIYREASHFLKV